MGMQSSVKVTSGSRLSQEALIQGKPATGLVEVGAEQVRYAGVLEKGMLIGLSVLFLSFLLYVFGVVEPYIPMHKVVEHWSLDVKAYLGSAAVKPGWGWVELVGYGDFLNLIGIALLAGTTILCYLAIVPILWQSHDRIYVALVIVQVIVLSAAASGMLGTGGH
jgi:hypothetical protein